MKSLPFLAALAMLAACAESPTAPPAQSTPNLSEVRAARNPNTTGQPGANCETSTTEPNGFLNSNGFAGATLVYAGGDNSHSNPNNPKAVSQYDVACYQLSNK